MDTKRIIMDTRKHIEKSFTFPLYAKHFNKGNSMTTYSYIQEMAQKNDFDYVVTILKENDFLGYDNLKSCLKDLYQEIREQGHFYFREWNTEDNEAFVENYIKGKI